MLLSCWFCNETGGRGSKRTLLTSKVISRMFLGICMTPESPSSPETHTQGLDVVMALLSVLMGMMTTRYGITTGTNMSEPDVTHSVGHSLFIYSLWSQPLMLPSSWGPHLPNLFLFFCQWSNVSNMFVCLCGKREIFLLTKKENQCVGQCM